MSEVFVGIVVNSPAERVRPIATRLAGVPPVEIVDLKPDAAVVFYRMRNERTFDQRADAMAAELSRELDAALVVRYDSRGLRTSRLYRGGAVAEEFGECNELYVPLDDDGRPEFAQPPTAFCRLDPLLEYESVQNAIELGLEALGGGNWSELKKVVNSRTK